MKNKVDYHQLVACSIIFIMKYVGVCVYVSVMIIAKVLNFITEAHVI